MGRADTASGGSLASSEDEKGSAQNHDHCRGRKAPAREGQQRRRRPAAPHLVDLLFGNGRIARPVMGEHIGPDTVRSTPYRMAAIRLIAFFAPVSELWKRLPGARKLTTKRKNIQFVAIF